MALIFFWGGFLSRLAPGKKEECGGAIFFSPGCAALTVGPLTFKPVGLAGGMHSLPGAWPWGVVWRPFRLQEGDRGSRGSG